MCQEHLKDPRMIPPMEGAYIRLVWYKPCGHQSAGTKSRRTMLRSLGRLKSSHTDSTHNRRFKVLGSMHTRRNILLHRPAAHSHRTYEISIKIVNWLTATEYNLEEATLVDMMHLSYTRGATNQSTIRPLNAKQISTGLTPLQQPRAGK
jgi:hypothetical protein